MTKKALTVAVFLTALLPASAVAQEPQLIGDGARVYSNACSRCHNARDSSERTDAAWVVIVAHMRARANLTKSEARAVLAYLQATNRPENVATGATPASASKPVTVEAPKSKDTGGG